MIPTRSFVDVSNAPLGAGPRQVPYQRKVTETFVKEDQGAVTDAPWIVQRVEIGEISWEMMMNELVNKLVQ